MNTPAQRLTMYRLQERWSKYRVAVRNNGKPTPVLWQDHYGLISGYWKMLVASVMNPTSRELLNVLIGLLEARRRQLLKPGGPIITKRNTVRRKRPPISRATITDHIDIAMTHLEVMRRSLKGPGWIERMLLRIGVLCPKGCYLTRVQVATLALSGTLFRLPFTESVRRDRTLASLSRIKRIFNRDQEERPKKLILIWSRRERIKNRLRHIAHPITGGMLFVKLSALYWGIVMRLTVSDRERMSLEAEEWVLKRLKSMGYNVLHVGGNKPYDILLEGEYRVEVKCAMPTKGSNGNIKRWQFNTRRYGQMVDKDIVILVIYDKGMENPRAFVIPGTEIRPDQYKIDITSEPGDYKGKWAEYLNQWSIVQRVTSNSPGELVKDDPKGVPF